MLRTPVTHENLHIILQHPDIDSVSKKILKRYFARKIFIYPAWSLSIDLLASDFELWDLDSCHQVGFYHPLLPQGIRELINSYIGGTNYHLEHRLTSYNFGLDDESEFDRGSYQQLWLNRSQAGLQSLSLYTLYEKLW
jgi:hypothetical protein